MAENGELPVPSDGKKSASISTLTNIHPNVLLAVQGVSKIFMGEVIEKAVEVRDRRLRAEASDPGEKSNLNPTPIHPTDIREAIRLLRQNKDGYYGPRNERNKKFSGIF